MIHDSKLTKKHTESQKNLSTINERKVVGKDEDQQSEIGEDCDADLEDDCPFNFELEKYDSMMFDSEEGNNTLTKFGKSKDISSSKEINQIVSSQGHPKKRSHPLSKNITSEIFDKPFSASKNLLGVKARVVSVQNINPLPSKEKTSADKATRIVEELKLPEIVEMSQDLRASGDSRDLGSLMSMIEGESP